MSIVIVLKVALLCTALTPSLADYNVLYVKPENQSVCPADPCHPLSYYVQNNSYYFQSDTMVLFLPGIHYLQANTSVFATNVTGLFLKSIGNTDQVIHPTHEPPAQIHCKGPAGVWIKFSHNVVIENLAFVGCGQVIPHSDQRCSSHATLEFEIVFNVILSGVSVLNSSGYGLCGNQILGNLTVFNSVFAFNSGSAEMYGGNAQLYYKNCPNISGGSHVQIETSKFTNGNNPHENAYAGGLSIVIECTAITINISNVVLDRNTGQRGGNLAISFHNITNSFSNTAIIENTNISRGSAAIGGGMHAYIVEVPFQSVNSTCNTTRVVFHIIGTTFSGNYADEAGGGVNMGYYELPGRFCGTGLILFEDCFFFNNTLGPDTFGGLAVHIERPLIPGYQPHGLPQFQTVFTACNFSQNKLFNSDSNNIMLSGTVFIEEDPSTNFTNSHFEGNKCTAIKAIRSNLIFQGNLTFHDNLGVNGGGLELCGGSIMYLLPHTNMRLSNNHALNSGGGIYAENECPQLKPTCFFQLDQSIASQPKLIETVHIYMANNTAGYAGTALYGGSVDYCTVVYIYGLRSLNFTSAELFSKVFEITPGSTPDYSAVTSDPIGVCFCNQTNARPNCSIKRFHVTALPGDMITIVAAVVGQRNGTLPGIIIANDSNSSSLDPFQKVQISPNATCTTLQYNVYSNKSHEIISLSSQKPHSTETFLPPQIIVTLNQCPLGLALTSNQPHCECIYLLKKNGVKCTTSNGSGTIHRPASSWVGYTAHGIIMFVSHCPFDYCKLSDVTLKSNETGFESSEQCAFNRKGVLCGTCQEGYSILLGSSKCLPCSNYYLLLLPIFALAGLLLVFFLTICNLTVTEGTINGLIFYANIVQGNKALFFPPVQDINGSPFLNAIHVTSQTFISWLNLDLGIETCFYDGMTAYTKTWLQFVFPLYIWVIAGLIVGLSRKYTVIARVSGRHSVQVLATLLLLTFSKFQRTIIAALSYGILDFSNGTQETLWILDGNMQYLKGKHFPLFIAALVVLVISLPYTFIFVFIQCLQRFNLSVTGRLKPFIDAYTGPYKDKYRFWTGHLLLVRIILFTTFGFTSLTIPVVDLLITIVASCHLLLLSVWVFRGVYKRWPLDVLESSFFLNLGILSAATAYILEKHYAPQVQIAFVNTSVGIAFATFLGVLLSHSYRQVTTSKPWKDLTTWLSKKRNPHTPLESILPAGDENLVESDSNEDVHAPLLPPPPPLAPYAQFDQYREPVLGFDDNTST